ncbi:MAG: hypothetical protein MZW92_72020 [Comamonadaceae bacterium]|nr:hypothetical protein [Comamonadaceae bacterium]
MAGAAAAPQPVDDDRASAADGSRRADARRPGPVTLEHRRPSTNPAGAADAAPSPGVHARPRRARRSSAPASASPT